MKYILIAYFLGNTYAKNCRNRTVYVKIIANCKGGTFFETQCPLAGRLWTAFKDNFFAAATTLSDCYFFHSYSGP